MPQTASYHIQRHQCSPITYPIHSLPRYSIVAPQHYFKLHMIPYRTNFCSHPYHPMLMHAISPHYPRTIHIVLHHSTHKQSLITKPCTDRVLLGCKKVIHISHRTLYTFFPIYPIAIASKATIQHVFTITNCNRFSVLCSLKVQGRSGMMYNESRKACVSNV